MKPKSIYVTTSDKRRLLDILASKGRLDGNEKRTLRDLQRELERAEEVSPEEIPTDVITMNSRFRLRDLDTGHEADYTLVYPGDADISKGKLSILAPIGTALLGYRERDIVEWEVPAGLKRFRIEELLHQPEANAATALQDG